VIRYLLGRALAWATTHLAAPIGSDYDRIDQEIELQYRRFPRQRNPQ
jgi:hypothetical protein